MGGTLDEYKTNDKKAKNRLYRATNSSMKYYVKSSDNQEKEVHQTSSWWDVSDTKTVLFHVPEGYVRTYKFSEDASKTIHVRNGKHEKVYARYMKITCADLVGPNEEKVEKLNEGYLKEKEFKELVGQFTRKC